MGLEDEPEVLRTPHLGGGCQLESELRVRYAEEEFIDPCHGAVDATSEPRDQP